MKTFQYNVDGIDCANCAKELEEEIGKLDGVSNCSLEFGVHSHLKYDYEGNDAEAIEKAMRKIRWCVSSLFTKQPGPRRADKQNAKCRARKTLSRGP